jgi:hypothetical protein
MNTRWCFVDWTKLDWLSNDGAVGWYLEALELARSWREAGDREGAAAFSRATRLGNLARIDRRNERRS